MIYFFAEILNVFREVNNFCIIRIFELLQRLDALIVKALLTKEIRISDQDIKQRNINIIIPYLYSLETFNYIFSVQLKSLNFPIQLKIYRCNFSNKNQF